MVEALKSLTGLRWREFHCFAAPHVVLQVTRRALVSRVIPAAGELAGRMACIIFMAAALSNAKFSGCMNSFEKFGFFASAFGSWLRFGVPKSENEFVAVELGLNMGLVHGVENFENRKFAQKLKLCHG